MTYEQALNYIHGTLKFGIKLGLHNIRTLLEFMDNPHNKLKYVHVAGTNGKGSTVAFISSILMASGYKVGIYTSPYIQRFTERMKINDEEISPNELARLAEFVKSKADIMVQQGENHPTEFEIVTAIAFQYFYEQNCDIVVLEVGLGGRFDSTNVIASSLVSVITTISYDHTSILGNTLPEIAFEKAGIIKPNCDVVLYPQPEDVEKVFGDICTERSAKLHKVDLSSIEITEMSIDGQVFNYEGNTALKILLLGEHQTKNAAVALKACELLSDKGYNITDKTKREGLEKARWQGRLEVLSKNPLLLIDGAHNREGAKALIQALNFYFPKRRVIFIMGILKDKDFKSIIETVTSIAYRFITVTPDSDRALSASELAEFIKPYCKNVLVSDTIEVAVKTALNEASTDDVICAFGSLYYIGKVRDIFNK